MNQAQLNAIQIENLSYYYKSNWMLGKKLSVKELSLNVKKSEAFGFLGHNGAGKTTTIKCILNLVKPTKGSIKIFGTDSTLTTARQRIGYVPEQPYFYEHLKVSELLNMYARLAGISYNEVHKKIDKTLELLNLKERKRSPMRSLSKGLTQKVAIAQAIIAEPKLLILDEPFSGLDPLGRKEITDLLLSLKEQGICIFMSSHILSDVEFVCDRVSILSKGELKGVYQINQIQDELPGYYKLVVKDASEIKTALIELSDKSEQKQNLLELHFELPVNAHKALSLASSQAEVYGFEFVHGGLEELFVKLVKEG